MKTNILKCIVIVLILAGSFSSCEMKSEFSNTPGHTTGTVIGSYFNGSASLLVQVDKKYPIGKTFEYIQYRCLSLPEYGTYKNMIEVQPRLPLYDFPENETIINKRISFSYRECRYGEEDFALFDTGKPGNAMCIHPDVPRYIITDCQIIK